MSELFRLTNSLFNVPHLATSETLSNVLEYLDSRNTGDIELSSKAPFSGANKGLDYNAETKIGTLQIQGPLTYKSTIVSALCNLTSYQKLESDFRSLVSLGAKTVILNIDSGGGEAYSAFETAALLRSLADENEVRLLAYVDGIAASAAYAFSCVAHEVIANPESNLGSIGVVVRLRNSNKQLEKAGIEETFLFAGQNKVPYSSNGDWSQSFIDDVQSKINSLYSSFTSFVAQYRNISVQEVANTEARVFIAKDAISLGLADAAMTREEFKNYVRKASFHGTTLLISLHKQP